MAKEASGKRRGRPPLKPGKAKRASFNTRLTEELKEQLEAAACRVGRSLSEEIELRLQQSIEKDAARGGPAYEALFQMMVMAASIIEARLGKSPFADPFASSAARSAWRQIIDSMTQETFSTHTEWHDLMQEYYTRAAEEEALPAARLRRLRELDRAFRESVEAAMEAFKQARALPARPRAK